MSTTQQKKEQTIGKQWSVLEYFIMSVLTYMALC